LIFVYFYGKINFGGSEYERNRKISPSSGSSYIYFLFGHLGGEREPEKKGSLFPRRREYLKIDKSL
jgi:hypothetical protein